MLSSGPDDMTSGILLSGPVVKATTMAEEALPSLPVCDWECGFNQVFVWVEADIRRPSVSRSQLQTAIGFTQR